MKLISIIMIIFVTAVYGGINYVIGISGYKTLIKLIPSLPPPIYWLVFWIIVFSFVAAMLFSDYLPLVVSYVLKLIGYYWMAAFFYFLLFWVFTGLIKLITKPISSSLYSSLFNPNSTFFACITITVVVIFLLVYGTFNANHPIIKKYKVTINKEFKNFKSLKIAFLSDIHIGEIVRGNRIDDMIDRINKLNPDLVLFGGDTIDDSPRTYIAESMADKFKKLKTKYGVYAILGNHEYYSNSTQLIVDSLSAGGVHVLRDKTSKIADSFYLIGREDLDSSRYNINRKPMTELLSGIDTTLPILVMDHQPPRNKKMLDKHIDLELCGHTHKGQMSPNDFFTRLIFLLDYGYKKYSNLNLIVSSGYGTWGPPIRLGNHPEIVEITLTSSHYK